MSDEPWSIADDELLRKLARAGTSMAEIAIQMNRNKSSIRSRTSTIKVCCSDFSRNSLRKLTGKIFRGTGIFGVHPRG
jgi:hypothetical protein